MKLDNWLHLIAGTIVMASVALGAFVSPWWLLVTVFVGANLFQSAFTGWCPMMSILRTCEVKEA